MRSRDLASPGTAGIHPRDAPAEAVPEALLHGRAVVVVVAAVAPRRTDSRRGEAEASGRAPTTPPIAPPPTIAPAWPPSGVGPAATPSWSTRPTAAAPSGATRPTAAAPAWATDAAPAGSPDRGEACATAGEAAAKATAGETAAEAT